MPRAKKKGRVKTVVTLVNSKTVRRSNRWGRWGEPPVVLYAKRVGGPLLKYTVAGKFAMRGRARYFDDAPAANLAAEILKLSFADELKGYRLFPK